MPNNATSKTIQELKNLSADQSVVPHIPREGIMGKASDGAWYNFGVNIDGTIGENTNLVIDSADPNNVILTKTVDSVSYQKTIVTSGTTVTISTWSAV